MVIKEVKMIHKEFSVAEAKKHFSEILSRVAYGHERIMILKRGKPLAVLLPPQEASKESHLSKVQGWLDEDDPFFTIMDRIVWDRKKHVPRILKSRKG
jgi:prevent-host-death family protein